MKKSYSLILGSILVVVILAFIAYKVALTKTPANFPPPTTEANIPNIPTAIDVTTSPTSSPANANGSNNFLLPSYFYGGAVVSMTYSSSKQLADIYITQNNQKRLLIKNVSAIDGPPVLSTTTDPSIINIRSGYGDGPGGFSENYYVILPAGNILKTYLGYGDNGYSSVSITDQLGHKTDFSDLFDESGCSNKTQPIAILNGIEVNQSAGYVFSPPFSLPCFINSPRYEEGTKSFYGAFEFLGFNKDLTQAYLRFSIADSVIPPMYFAFVLNTELLEKLNNKPIDLIY